MASNNFFKILSIIFIAVLAILYLNSTIWFKIKLADYYFRKGREDNVIYVYENILRKINVKSGNTLYREYKLANYNEYRIVGKIAKYYYARDKEKALTYYQNLTELSSHEEINYHELFSIYKFLKVTDIRQVVKYAARYEKYFNKNIPLEFSGYKLWNYRLGCALLNEGILSRAVEELNIAVSLDPGFADAYFQLGKAYEKSGKEEDAIEKYEETLKILPLHLESLGSLYKIYMRRNLAAKVEKILRVITDLTPPKKMDIVLAEKITVTGFNMNQISDKKIKLVFWFKCIDKIDSDYALWLNGVLKFRFIRENMKEKGSFNLNAVKNDPKWQIGEVFKQTFLIDIDPAHYDFKLGFWAEVPGGKVSDSKQVDLFD